MIAIKRSAAVLAALAVIVLPGSLLVIGALWLYRYVMQSQKSALKH